MPQTTSTISVSQTEVRTKIAAGIGVLVLAALGFMTGHWGWGILGIFIALVFFAISQASGKANCPFCNHQLSGLAAAGTVRCSSCREFLQVKEQRLEALDENMITNEPYFPVELPWDDLDRVVSPSLGFSPTDFANTFGPPRIIPAIWPPGCCVCGQTATKDENTSMTVIKSGRFLNQRFSINANGVPHCTQHSGGVSVSFDTVGSADSGRAPMLLFRSYRYYKSFQRANRWKPESSLKTNANG